MTATDHAVRPKVLRFASSKDQQCTGCGTAIGRGDRAGFDCNTGPDVLCAACCDHRDGGAQPAAPAPTEQPPVAAPERPAAGEPTTDEQPTPAVDTCSCSKRGGAGDGFTNAAGTGEPPRYVHAACGLPAPGAARGWGSGSDAAMRSPAQNRAIAQGATVDQPAAAKPPTLPAVVEPEPSVPSTIETPAAVRDEFRILITGSRDWTDRASVRAAIEQALVDVTGTVDVDEGIRELVTIVHGDAPGADTLAGEVAAALRCPVETYPADWSGAGNAAGPQRNARMVAGGADLCLAFPIGESRGTRDCMAKANDAGIPVRVVDVHPETRDYPPPAAPAGSDAPMTTDQPKPKPKPAGVDLPSHSDEQTAVAQGATRPDTPEPAPQPVLVAHNAGDDPLPDLSGWAGEATARHADPEHVGAELVEAWRLGILAGDIRSRQREIGPSEVGHPCARALAYRLAGTPHTGTQQTPWRQAVGTALHERGDLWAHLDNARRGTRWLTNIKVDVGDLYPGRPITGHLDYLDVLTATVLDGKNPGTTAMKKYGKGKPESEQYRKQVQLYGRGVHRAGFLPQHVGILRVSPARELAEYVWKVEPYDEQVAVDALTRAGGIARMVDQLGQQAPGLLPPTDFNCHRCDWFKPASPDLAAGCPGAPGAELGRRRASVDDLVA